MRKIFSIVILLLMVNKAVLGAVAFSLKGVNAVTYSDDYLRHTAGKEAVFVVDSLTKEASLVFSNTLADSLYNVKWYSFTNSADDLKAIEQSKYSISGNSAELKKEALAEDCGFAMEYTDEDASDTSRFYVWISRYMPLEKVTWETDKSYCETLPLRLSPVAYYTPVDGLKTVIRRTFDVMFDVYEMPNGNLNTSKTLTLTGDTVLRITNLPTVNTPFTITEVNHDDVFVTDTFHTRAVNAFPSVSVADKAKNEGDDFDSAMTDDEGNLVYYFGDAVKFRSSAPLALNLKSNISPMVDDIQWQISSDSLFLNSYTIYNKQAVYNYEFKQAGQHCIKLIVKNRDSECEYEDMMCFKIANSELYIPNTFTPNGDGKNDEFRVVFTSIEKYDCRIYNQWGKKVFDSNDPAKGWDGTNGSNKEPTGVYFYVIKAKGTDGVEYNKKGTINLLRSVD